MSEISIEELVDIREVEVDLSINMSDRMSSYLNQIIDPYHFRYKNIEVTVEFVGKESLEDRLVGFLKTKIN